MILSVPAFIALGFGQLLSITFDSLRNSFLPPVVLIVNVEPVVSVYVTFLYNVYGITTFIVITGAVCPDGAGPVIDTVAIPTSLAVIVSPITSIRRDFSV